jgi:hypothetical protein
LLRYRKNVREERESAARREKPDATRHHPLLEQGTTKTHGEKCAASGARPGFVRCLSGVAFGVCSEDVE